MPSPRRDPPLADLNRKARNSHGTQPIRGTTRASQQPFQAASCGAAKVFAAQDRVTHDAHGLGTVLAVEEGVAVLVDFGTEKLRIPTPYDRLFKL